MEIIDVNEENIEKEHICCALSEMDGRVKSKKNWMKEEFKNGLVFKKLNVRGKVFIEYIPIENAYAIAEGENYIYINCFWVSGKYKGQGYGEMLLKACIEDAKNKGKRGLVALAGDKKKPFLSDGSFYKYKGFKIADTMEPYYELLYLNFDDMDKNKPKFKKNLDGLVKNKDIVIYYSNQCPHTSMYVDIFEKIARKRKVDIEIVKFTSKEEAQKSPNPFTTYSVYVKDKFVTNEILSEKKIVKLIEDNKLGE